MQPHLGLHLDHEWRFSPTIGSTCRLRGALAATFQPTAVWTGITAASSVLGKGGDPRKHAKVTWTFDSPP